MAAAAIFSQAVVCSISLRWYNRDKRAEECQGAQNAGEGVKLRKKNKIDMIY